MTTMLECKKKKVLMFLQSEVGGAERVTVTIGKNLDAVAFDVHFYAAGPWDCKIADFIPKNLYCGHLKYKNPFRLLFAFYKTIRTESPDIVFASTMYISTKLLLLSLFFKKTKFIIRCENNLYTFSKKQQLMIRLLYRRAEKIIAQTDEMRTELITRALLPERKIITIQNPLDCKSIDSLAEKRTPFVENDKIFYVASGRFAPEKGFDILVQAFAQVIKKINNAELFIVGRISGPSEKFYSRIKEQIKSLGLSKKVHCVGYQKNPYVYVKNANCFVLSSRSEGLPNAMIEALYLETPVAATTCIPAIERIVENGKTGFLAIPENIESLAQAMINAVSLGRVKSRMIKNTIPCFNEIFFGL